jgi:diguanylate cyclase (GGDEF)-like protein/PAS domain S-box-containing protein
MPHEKSVPPARPRRAAPARPQSTELSELETAEAELRIIHDAMACGLIVLSPEWNVLRMNDAAEAILGWRLTELRDRPFLWPGNAILEDEPHFAAGPGPASTGLRSGHPLKNTILAIRRRDGQRRWLQVDIVPALHADGTPRLIVCSFLDITERKLAEEALQESEARYRLLFDRNPHPTWVNDRDTQTFLVVNEAAVHHYGYTREEFLSMTARDLRPPEDVEAFVSELAGPGPAVSRLARRWRHKKKDGSVIHVEVDSHPLMFAGRAARVAVVTDITERKQAEEALQHQALHDELTGLTNRTLLQERLSQTILTAQRENTPLTLLLVDLDRFKEINDTFGHHYGDLLLQQIGPRLRDCIRASDTVARLGGDEFGILLPTTDAANAVTIAQQLLRTLEAPFELDGQPVEIGASIGLASYPAHGGDAATLLRRADVAMYVAKRAESGVVVYTAEQDHYSAERLALGGELRRALEHNELLLHYQPKLDLRDGTLVGAEALVRWQHPQRGFLPPSEFIPLAEQTGLILPLTRWVLEATLRQQHAWRAGGLELVVAVNLSRRTLQDPQLPAMVAQMLARFGVPPSALVLEITESSLMADPQRAAENLSQLRALGVGLSIDDFGTGYSSLDSLKNLSVDELKIDRSFVQAMATDASARAIVRAIIDLADALKLRVVAEGVEDRATWDVLARLGCDVAQGYFLSRPIAATELEAWITQVSQTWLDIAQKSRVVDSLQERIRGRGARLTAEEEFIARKQAEAALRACEERNRLALRAAGMGTWDWDVIRDVQSWSTETEALSGLAPGTFDGTVAAFKRSVHPDDWPAVELESQAMIAERRDSLATYRTVWPDGSVHWIQGRGHALYAADGTVVRVTGTALDITQRKLAEEALRASEERFRKQYKGIPVPTYSWLHLGSDFVLQDYNDAAEVNSEGDIADLLGIRASARFADQPEILADLQACVTEQRTIRRETQHRYQSTGQQRHLAFTYVFVPPQTVMVHREDITETKHTEQQCEAMAQSAKLPAVVQMSTRIAHDLNQSLTLVASSSDLARQALLRDPPNLLEVENLLTTTIQAALDGVETVKQHHLFTRDAPNNERQPVDLASLVRDQQRAG